MAARLHAPDLYLSALLAPRAARPHLIALAAFAGDIDRIIARVSDPALAEIRLQWWRDAIAQAQRNERTGHPVADALGAAVRAYDLPFAAFDGLLDARALDLYADPLPGPDAFDAYLTRVDGALMRLAALCLGHASPSSSLLPSPAPSSSGLIGHTARAYGIARCLAHTAIFQARGRAPFPVLEAPHDAPYRRTADAYRGIARAAAREAQIAWKSSTRTERLACLPLALVEPYLRATEQPGHDPLHAIATIEPLERAWRLWQAHAWGRFMKQRTGVDA